MRELGAQLPAPRPQRRTTPLRHARRHPPMDRIGLRHAQRPALARTPRRPHPARPHHPHRPTPARARRRLLAQLAHRQPRPPPHRLRRRRAVPRAARSPCGRAGLRAGWRKRAAAARATIGRGHGRPASRRRLTRCRTRETLESWAHPLDRVMRPTCHPVDHSSMKRTLLLVPALVAAFALAGSSSARQTDLPSVRLSPEALAPQLGAALDPDSPRSRCPFARAAPAPPSHVPGRRASS